MPSLKEVTTERTSPVIAVLDGGGTLSSNVRRRGDLLYIGRPSDSVPLTRAVQSGVDRLMPQYYGWTKNLLSRAESLELEWFELKRNYKILSENATPAHWAHLVERLNDIAGDEFQGGAPLAGIVLIHGTDTMAQAIAAVRFAVERQTVPVVFVGSNTPLLGDDPEQRPLIACESDGWHNLFTAVAYCFLSRCISPQVVLSFASCIHYPLNLRKLHHQSIAAIMAPEGTQFAPLDRWRPSALPREPYIFHNLLSKGKYIFRNVEGRLVYSHREFLDEPSKIPGVSPWTPLKTDSPGVICAPDAYTRTVGCVAHVSASVATPCLNFRHPSLANIKALLVETYESGTVPTVRGHPFHAILKQCAKRNVPIFLSARFGIETGQKYEVALSERHGVVMYQISNIIPETAIALLQRACDVCHAESWPPNRPARNRAEDLRDAMLGILEGVERDCPQLDCETQIVSFE